MWADVSGNGPQSTPCPALKPAIFAASFPLQMNAPIRQTDPLILSGRDVTAVLGPTNTGKTHLAIERMVAHESGVIGLPLRLLAREVYARV